MPGIDYELTKNQLLSEILEKTSSGKLKWSEDAEKGAYSTTLAGRFVVRTLVTPAFTRKVRVYNDQNVELFSFLETKDDDMTDVYRIYDAARRSALGLDKALTEILGELGKL